MHNKKAWLTFATITGMALLMSSAYAQNSEIATQTHSQGKPKAVDAVNGILKLPPFTLQMAK